MKFSAAVVGLGMVLLAGVGLVAVASVGDVASLRIHGRPDRLFLLQLGFFAAGLAVAVAAARVNPSFWMRRGVVLALAGFALAGLVAVHVPGLGVRVNGSSRWVRLPGLSVQPSEFVKLAAVFVTAWWVGDPELDRRRFVRSALVPAAWLGTLVLGLMVEPDLGSSVMLIAVNGALLFVGGVRLRYLAVLGAAAAVALGLYVLHDPERLSRITAVFGGGDRTEQFAAGRGGRDQDAYQLEMGLTAFAAGGATGVGLGNSLLKHSYLPENHTDFILAMVGEEMGLAATLPCLLVFFAMGLAGFRGALSVADPRLRLAALGLTLHLSLSAAVNVGVVTGAFPTKGLALPFLSYGGSNLVASFLAGGLLIGILLRARPVRGRFADEPPPAPPVRGEPLAADWGL